jgi:hypothetical protein
MKHRPFTQVDVFTALPYLGNPFSREKLGRRESRFLPFFNLQAIWLLGEIKGRSQMGN